MQQDQKSFLQGVKSLLSYHQAIGVPGYPLNRDTGSFLKFLPDPVREAGPAAGATRQAGAGGAAARPVAVTLAEIGEEVVACRACDLHRQRIYPVVGRGPATARLMIVGDWLRAEPEARLPPGQLFGVEQDQMLARMLTAINLPVSEVFIANVIKCAIPATVQPQAAHVQSCVSHLRRQIAAVAPEAILAMGMVAARVILEKSQPLSRLRGRFHEFEWSPGRRIPVLATYHPTYLLQNAEMKAATWADLQLLARHLGLKAG